MKPEFLVDMTYKDNDTEIETNLFLDRIEKSYQKWAKQPANKNKSRKEAPWPTFIRNSTLYSVRTAFNITGVVFSIAELMTVYYNYMLIFLIGFLSDEAATL